MKAGNIVCEFRSREAFACAQRLRLERDRLQQPGRYADLLVVDRRAAAEEARIIRQAEQIEMIAGREYEFERVVSECNQRDLSGVIRK